MDLDPLDYLVDYTAPDFKQKAEQSRQAEAQAEEKRRKLAEQIAQLDIAQRQATLDLTNVQSKNSISDNVKQMIVAMDKSLQERQKIYISAAKEGVELPPLPSMEDLMKIARSFVEDQMVPKQPVGDMPGPAAAPGEPV
jgi:hypothetical protein